MKGFSDAERERIREQLIETARELLRMYGPKKTNIEDITEPAGIAKSTFYRFFDSKVDLYVEIMERESDEMLREIEREIDQSETPREALERVIRCVMTFAETNPLVQYREEFLSSFSPEKMKEISAEQFEEYIPLIEAVQEEAGGPVAEYDPEVIFGVIGVAEYAAINKAEFEMYRDGYYEEVKDLLVPVLANGLLVDPEQ